MGFVDLAKGMGVAGTYVAKADDIKAAVAAAFKSGKPHLIEIEIEGKRCHTRLGRLSRYRARLSRSARMTER